MVGAERVDGGGGEIGDKRRGEVGGCGWSCGGLGGGGSGGSGAGGGGRARRGSSALVFSFLVVSGESWEWVGLWRVEGREMGM